MQFKEAVKDVLVPKSYYDKAMKRGRLLSAVFFFESEQQEFLN